MTISDNPNWHRRVWRLAGPIMLSNITVPLLGIVDTAVIGHLDHAYYLGAVAVGALIFNFLFWGFGFLRMGTTGFTAQAHGAGDHAEMAAMLWRGAIAAALIGACLLALQTPLITAALALMNASDAVSDHAGRYYATRIWSAPAALANYVILGWFLGLQNARAGFVIQVVINLINIALDLVFVIGLAMAVEGVALATVIAEYAGLALGAVMVWRTLSRLDGRAGWSRILDPARFRHMIAINRDIFLRTLCLIAAFAYLTAQGARMGDVVLAANAVLFNMVTFTAYALEGLAGASQAMVGRAVGAGSKIDYRGAVRCTTQWALGFAAAFAVAYALTGNLIIDVMTTMPEVRAVAYAVLPWMVAAPLVSVWGYQFDGIFIGATRSGEMRNAMIVSLLIYLIATEAFRPLLGNHGIWLGFTVFMIARGVTLAYYYPKIERSISAG